MGTRVIKAALCIFFAESLAIADGVRIPAHTTKPRVPHSEVASIESTPGYQFKATTPKGRVIETMREAEHGQVGTVNLLMDLYENKPDEILSLLEPYTKDASEDVRFAVILAAERVHTDKAMSLLVTIVSDKMISHEAIRRLYDGYSRTELIDKGGAKLRSALRWAVITNRYSTYGTILLSLYKNDPGIVAFLESRRKSYGDNDRAQTSSQPPGISNLPKGEGAGRPTVDEVTCIDLALTELGNADAVARVRQLFSQRKPAALSAVLRYLKFINAKEILLKSVALLKDKDHVREIGFPGQPPVYLRVCDEALPALRFRAGLSENLDYSSRKRYSDGELAQAYQRLKAVFEAL